MANVPERSAHPTRAAAGGLLSEDAVVRAVMAHLEADSVINSTNDVS